MPKIHRECVKCLHDFYISEQDQRYADKHNTDLPKECFACRPEEDLYRECVQCSKEFYVTADEQKFFRSNDLIVPKRCWNCRQANKAKRAQEKHSPSKRVKSDHRPPPHQNDKPVSFFVEEGSPDSEREWANTWSPKNRKGQNR